AEDEPEIVMQRRDAGQDFLERAALQLLLHEVRGEYGDAGLGVDALADGLDRTEAYDAPEAQAITAPLGVLPVVEERELGIDVEERMRPGVLDARERVALEERSRADEDVLLTVQADSIELGIGEARRGDRAVDLHRARAEQEVGPGAEVQVELD